MALRGRAVLAIWCDGPADDEAGFDAWYTRQHVPERLGVPGFLRGRRGLDPDSDHQRLFALYETATPETLTSDGYRARLNNPTRWSNRSQPGFRNFTRAACILCASTGRGIGGALATIRLSMDEDALTGFEAAAERLAHAIAALDGVTGAHLAVAAPEITRTKTKETELRAGTGEGEGFDALVMVEATGRRNLLAAMSGVRALLLDGLEVKAEQSGVYDLIYVLTAEDVA